MKRLRKRLPNPCAGYGARFKNLTEDGQEHTRHLCSILILFELDRDREYEILAFISAFILTMAFHTIKLQLWGFKPSSRETMVNNNKNSDETSL